MGSRSDRFQERGKVGAETVGGVKPTRYERTIILDEWRDQLKDEDKQTRERRERALDP
jgi:hypothetical protein